MTPPQSVAEVVAAPPALRVGGVVPFSTTDWPGRLAAVVFLQGCPWRCGYCHNPHLQSVEAEEPQALDGVVEWLETRRGLIDGVVFSGGEPTAQPRLRDAIAVVRGMGFATALHTGGMYPRKIPELLPLLDWVGLDIKAPTADYERVTGVPRSGISAFVSLALLHASSVPHEIRTTVHPRLTPDEALERLAQELARAGVREWTLQPFRPVGCDGDRAAPIGPAVTIEPALVERLRAHVPTIHVRA